MGGFRSIIITFLLIGLVSLSFIMFLTKFEIDNSISGGLATDSGIINLSSQLNSSLITYSNDSNSSIAAFTNSEPTVGAESLQLTSVSGIWNTMIRIPYIIYKSTLGYIFDNVFGDSGFAIVMTTLTSIAIIVFVLYAWKWIRGGDPD